MQALSTLCSLMITAASFGSKTDYSQTQNASGRQIHQLCGNLYPSEKLASILFCWLDWYEQGKEIIPKLGICQIRKLSSYRLSGVLLHDKAVMPGQRFLEKKILQRQFCQLLNVSMRQLWIIKPYGPNYPWAISKKSSENNDPELKKIKSSPQKTQSQLQWPPEQANRLATLQKMPSSKALCESPYVQSIQNRDSPRGLWEYANKYNFNKKDSMGIKGAIESFRRSRDLPYWNIASTERREIQVHNRKHR